MEFAGGLSQFISNYGLYLGLVVLLVIGFIRIFRIVINIDERIEFTNEFREHFHQFCDSDFTDAQSYGRLIYDSSRMQNLMGGWGIADFRPPYQNYIMKNCRLILDILPQIRQVGQDRILTDIASQYAAYIDEALLRFAGVLDRRRDAAGKEIKNPLAWLREGVEWLLSLPLSLLAGLGLLSSSRVERAEEHVVFRLVSGMFSLLYFLSLLVTVLSGWDDLSAIVAELPF